MIIARKPGVNPTSQGSRDEALVLWFEEVGIADIPLVGGKNASLGEMIQQLEPEGVNVPTGFATTAYAFRYFIRLAGLEEQLRQLLSDLDAADMDNLQERGKQARSLIFHTPFPPELEQAITESYIQLCQRYGSPHEVCDTLETDRQADCLHHTSDVDVAV
ncbi:MAG TPA: PEP/pyruvate-binding domain-containing protein, partial [Coleofasciculaceae cyanobacterium]